MANYPALDVFRNGLQSALQGHVRSFYLVPSHACMRGGRCGRDGEKGGKPQHLGFDSGLGDAPLIHDHVESTREIRIGCCNDLIITGVCGGLLLSHYLALGSVRKTVRGFGCGLALP
jgi:hypothetical protein